ncbi:hypothetical protein ACTWPT_49085 [Nonomuraea sp. 3N208]|uniref:hypothetical protein n=1 Tax=Nonomuraea sp. 3N208 TaxID=3457421 RepID=UPI003FD05E50
MSLPPEHRLSTITNYLVRMDAQLAAPRFRGSDIVTTLREQTGLRADQLPNQLDRVRSTIFTPWPGTSWR